jgi:hypothetical protein
MIRDLPRPRIKVTADLSKTVDETVAALMSYNDLYQYNGRLARIRDNGIQMLNSSMLRYYASKAAVFYKETKSGDKEMYPPTDVMQCILALHEYDLPEIFVRLPHEQSECAWKPCNTCGFLKGRSNQAVICDCDDCDDDSGGW